MNKLLDGIRGLKDKWLNLSKTKKIVSIILVVALIAAITVGTVSATRTKYGVLYSNLNSTDANTVITKLKSDKVDYKVDSSTNTIYVPQNKMDDLRLEYASSIKNGSTGFELFDNSSSQFGMTDQQFSVTYQRALQGEIERTIKSLPAVDDARVEIVMPDDSTFVKDSSPAKASVYLKLKAGQTLNKSQVKAIVALVSGAVKNLPAANVQVVDNNMNLLTEGLNNSNSSSSSDLTETTSQRSAAEQKEESALQKKILSQLEAVYGKDKVKVQVNADMNFDSTQQDSTVVQNPVVVSEHDINEVNPNGNSTTTSGSPNDNNNSSNQIVNQTTSGQGSSRTETTKNYDTSKTETKTTVAPGDIRKLTVSVLVDGKVSNATQTSINNIVSQAAGINSQRGDTVSVEGMRFDTSLAKAEQKALDEMNAQKQTDQRNALIRNIVIGSVLGIAAIVGLILFIRKRRRDREYDDDYEYDDEDVDVDDTIAPKEETEQFAPIEFEKKTEKSHMENEIKNYANNKPEQVADVVKAWLAEDER